MRPWNLTVVAALLLALVPLAQAVGDARDLVRLAYAGMCSGAISYIDNLFRPNSASCEVVADGKKVVMLFGAPVPLFGTDSVRRPWAAIVVLAAGKVIRSHPDLRVDELVLTDTDLVKRGEGARVAASWAAHLQEEAQADRGPMGVALLDEIDRHLRVERVLLP